MVTLATDSEIQQFLATQPKVMLMFCANWCGSCRLFFAKYEKLSNKQDYSAIQFFKINAEEAPIIRKMAGVDALPFFAIFNHGKLQQAFATTKEDKILSMAKMLLTDNE